MTQKPKLIAVYQPHQNSRQHQLKDQYKDSFEKADKIYWLDTYLSREDPNLSILSKDQLIQGIQGDIEAVDWNQEFLDKLQKHRENQDLIVFMGAGSIDKWVRDWLRLD